MLIKTFPSILNFAHPRWAPEDDFGGGDDDAFVERPGDREPEPDVEITAGEEPHEEGHEEPEAQHEADDAGEEEPPEKAPAAEAEAEEEPEPEEPRKRDWRDRQLEKRAKQLEEAKQEIDNARAEAEAIKALYAKPEGEGGATPITPEEAIRIAERNIEQRNYAKRLNEGADALFDKGAKAFPKSWETRVRAAGELFGDEIRAKPAFLEIVTDLPNGEAVYHELAGDPDQMEKLLRLPDHKMGVELARMADKLAAKPALQISRVSAPIKPLDKPVKSERTLDELMNDPKASMAEIDRRMAAEEEKRAKARRY